MKRSVLAFVAVVAMLPAIHAPAAVAQSLSPREAIQKTSDEVLAVLRQRELPLEERRRLIQEIADSRFDSETISRLVLARHWRRFTPAQRETFTTEMKRHILVNYGDRLDRYDQEGVEILGQRPEARGDVTVRTRLSGGEAEGLAVDYRMRARDGQWYVIDVVVEGVSVVKSYRAQFQEMLANGSPDDLLDELRAKNDATAENARATVKGGSSGEAVPAAPAPSGEEASAS